MASFLYVIVPASSAGKLGLTEVRQKLANGCYLLNQKDFIMQPGDTLWERIRAYNGVILSEPEALMIMNGQLTPPNPPEEEETEEQNSEGILNKQEVESSNIEKL